MVVVDVLARIQTLLRQGFGIPSGNGKLLLAGKPRAQNRWVERMEARRENRRGQNKKRYPNNIRGNGHKLSQLKKGIWLEYRILSKICLANE